MKTIRGKITIFFIACLTFVAVLTALYYKNSFDLRKKITIIESFDDLLNDILELRRYEKNFIYYGDTDSLNESVFYLFRVENGCISHADDITRVVGRDERIKFQENLEAYKHILEENMALVKGGKGQFQVEKIREKGKALVDFAQELIRFKRQRIEHALSRTLTMPIAFLGSFVILTIVVFQLVNRGILKPLTLVERATEEVAKETFTPISYPTEKRDEITRLIAAFNRMAGELESRQEQLLQSRKMASIGTFTSGIAHELNNPLNNISLTAETLQLGYQGMSEEEMDEMIGDILSQADRASQVVKNLLEFSRKERPYLRNMDVKDVIDKTLRLIKNQIMVGGFHLEKEIADDLPPIRGKHQDLEQAFLNILMNGIQAMPEAGTISVRAGRGPEGYIRVDLSDTGKGIKPADMEHIFDPFYTTKEVGRGTGLGLSLVYSIIRAHGGYIEVKSEIDKRTTFSIYLPVAKEKEQGEQYET